MHWYTIDRSKIDVYAMHFKRVDGKSVYTRYELDVCNDEELGEYGAGYVNFVKDYLPSNEKLGLGYEPFCIKDPDNTLTLQGSHKTWSNLDLGSEFIHVIVA